MRFRIAPSLGLLVHKRKVRRECDRHNENSSFTHIRTIPIGNDITPQTTKFNELENLPVHVFFDNIKGRRCLVTQGGRLGSWAH